jgi:hypothetical protein
MGHYQVRLHWSGGLRRQHFVSPVNFCEYSSTSAWHKPRPDIELSVCRREYRPSLLPVRAWDVPNRIWSVCPAWEAWGFCTWCHSQGSLFATINELSPAMSWSDSNGSACRFEYRPRLQLVRTRDLSNRIRSGCTGLKGWGFCILLHCPCDSYRD